MNTRAEKIKEPSPAELKAMLSQSTDALGELLFKQLLVPFIEKARKGMSPMDLALLYTGFISGCLGEMAGDFEPEVLLHILQDRMDCIKSVIDPVGGMQ